MGRSRPLQSPRSRAYESCRQVSALVGPRLAPFPFCPMERGGTSRWKKPDRRTRYCTAAPLQILDQPDRYPSAFRFSLRSGEHLWIRIQSNDIHGGMKFLDQYSESPGAAADIEDLKTRLYSCLIEERSSSPPRHRPASRKDRKAAIANRGQQQEDMLFRNQPHS